MNTQEAVRPQAHAFITAHEVVLTLPNGQSDRFRTAKGEDSRAQVVMRLVEAAVSLESAVDVTTEGIHGHAEFTVHPDGRAVPTAVRSGEALPAAEEVGEIVDHVPAAVSEPTSRTVTPGDVPVPPKPSLPVSPPAETIEKAEAELPQLRRDRRVSFIDTSEPLHAKPTSWWRRAATAMGIKVGASAADLERERCRRAVSTQWGDARRVAVLNGKGGVGKTTTTGMLAAIFAREGGGGVLAWDNNPTRGTLGWRTESARHDATVQDMLEQAEQLLDPSASRALIADFVHHQTDDRYDVLRSNPELLAIRQQIQEDEFDLLVRVVDRSYRLVIFDSGNDESATRWLRMVDWSHQLVIPTTTSPESAESAMLLLEELAKRDEHSRRLAERAIVVVLDTEQKTSPAAGAEIAAGFESVGIRTFRVPFDKALVSGPLRFGQLAEPTREAWLRIAAAATEAF